MYSKLLISTSLAVGFFVGAASLLHAEAQQEYVPKAIATTLHEGALPGMDGKEMIVKHFALPPGHVGGKHMHPGPVYVYVLEGVLTVETETETRSIAAGELYAEELNTAMQARNLSASEDVEILVIQVGDVGKPMMVKVE